MHWKYLFLLIRYLTIYTQLHTYNHINNNWSIILQKYVLVWLDVYPVNSVQNSINQ